MAKQSAPKAGTSRIRFIMLDAEIQDGDLSQITEAIQNALRPSSTTIIQQRVQGRPAIANLPPEAVEVDADHDNESFDAEEAPDAKPARQKVAPRARKPTTPKVVDIDLNTGVSFESYATPKAPKNEMERNLVILGWFHEHRGKEPVTVGHVYTCYKAMKWPSGIEDFSWPLRSLKKEQLIGSSKRGEYVINHLGLARVEKMGAAV